MCLHACRPVWLQRSPFVSGYATTKKKGADRSVRPDYGPCLDDRGGSAEVERS